MKTGAAPALLSPSPARIRSALLLVPDLEYPRGRCWRPILARPCVRDGHKLTERKMRNEIEIFGRT